jgi:molybdopterin molybdotransferase
VTFELLVRPAVNALLGLPEPLPRLATGVLTTAVERNAARDEFVRARLRHGDDGPVLDPLAGQESHMIARSAGADALVAIEAGEGEVPAGAAVRYLPL